MAYLLVSGVIVFLLKSYTPTLLFGLGLKELAFASVHLVTLLLRSGFSMYI